MRGDVFNGYPGNQAGILVTDGGHLGHTENTSEIAAKLEKEWLTRINMLRPQELSGRKADDVPVVYVQLPAAARPRSICRAILAFFGADHHRMGLAELTKAARISLNDHGVRVLLLDGFTRVNVYRVDDQDTLDLLRAFVSMNTTLVLIGVDAPGSTDWPDRVPRRRGRRPATALSKAKEDPS
ncbi:TniB family NTP-binding protein [Actinoplanes sp. NPDC024001]|uniref:TniB family NTP-binding protein n=1 Tax=Actinoplanes sp. NPDC024001 TaxID=3154598 RepID=UPI0033DF4E35